MKKPSKSSGFEILPICIALALIALIAISVFLLSRPSPEDAAADNSLCRPGNENCVVRVIDGDTFVIAGTGNETTVRLLCIDAPEVGTTGADEATAFLSSLILWREVRLEKDVSETDAYGRLLRYVYVADENGTELFVNKEIIQRGYADVFRYEPDTKRCFDIAS